MTQTGTGWLRILGLGPGPLHWQTPEVTTLLGEAGHVFGYLPYIQRLPPAITAACHASDNGDELARARAALRLAALGEKVAVISGGDAGIFGMASAVCEAIEQGEPAWRNLDVQVLPGLSVLLAAAARLGAPLGHDFCVISLSDRLKPWAIIERRLRAASDGDMALALYNPASRSRRQGLEQAIACLLAQRGGDTIVMVARDIGGAAEHVDVTSLSDLDMMRVDMRCLLLIGASNTRRIERPGLPPLVYTPRSYS